MAKNSRRIQIRVTDEEYEDMLRQKEFLNHKTYSDLIRMYINNAVCFTADFNGLFEVSHQIAKIGTNINQIAKAVNETHFINSDQIDSIKEDMNKLEKEVAKAVKAKARISKYVARVTSGGGNLGNYEDYKDQEQSKVVH